MALYPQLLLNRGGGIISDSSKAAQSKDGATIVIGLGGTGVDCLKNFKKQVYGRILPDNYDPNRETGIPEYKHIKFWAIDTAEGSIKSDDKDMSEGYDSITKSEFLKISVNDITAALQAHGQLNRNVNLKWLAHEKEGTSEPIAIQDMHDGAGGIRQAGRFAVIYKASDVINKLSALISDAATDGHNKISVHIFSGIGGGTGSGCFLDICYLTKMLLQQKGLGGSATVCGYFFLPDVNLSNAEIASNNLLREQIESNGYAALQELDYCMNFEKNGGQWDQYYNGTHYTTKLPPVDLCHLISAQTIDGNHTDNSYEYAMNVVADYVLEFAAEQGNGFDMDQHRANVAGQVSRIQGDTGAKYVYGVLGASCAAVPYREINTYLATKLFAKFRSIYDAKPGNAAVESFASKVGLSFNSMFREFCKGADCEGYLGIAKQFDVKTLKTGMSPLFAAFNKYSQEIVGKQETNGRNLAMDLDDSYQPEQAASNSTAMISRIFQQLYTAVLCDPAQGPFMAHNILNGLNNESLVKIVDGIIATNNERIIDYTNWLEQAENRRNIAKAAYLQKQSKSNTQDHVNAEINWYTNYSYKTAAENFAGVLMAIKANITKLANNYFAKLCRVLNNLKDTFAENESALEAMMAKNDYDTVYVRPIMTIAELLPAMQETLKHTSFDECLKDMITAMCAQPDRWMSEDAFKISKFVNDYMANRVFAEFASRSVLEFLKMKYNDDDTTHIEKYLEETEIAQLETFSKALFWMDSTYNLNETSTIEYVYVPANESTLVNAANSFKKGKESLTVRTGSLTDRISFMKFYCGVPMFAYKGLEKYELTYCNKSKPGTHLYERGEDHKWHWETYLPSPIPASFDRREDNKKSEKREEEALALYADAKKSGIGKLEGEDFVIRRFDYSEIQAGFKKAEDLAAKGRKAEGKQAYDDTHKKLIDKDLTVISDYVIGGSPKGEHIVQDKFVMYPEYRDIVTGEMAAYAELVKRDEKVKDLFDDGDYTIFKDAYFIGQIQFTGLFNIKLFVEDEYGFAEEYELCGVNSPMKTVPVYQAYKSFCALEKDLKNTVKAKNEEYLAFEDQEKIDEIKKGVQAAMNKYNPKYIQALQNASKTCGDPAGAMGFLKNFIMDLHTFNDMIEASF